MQTMYTKTIRVNNDTLNKLVDGELVFKTGQWIQLEWCSKPSRWVGRLPSGTVWAVHYPTTIDQFVAMTNSYRKRNG